MRILHVITSLDPRGGGPPAALRGLCAAQREVLGAEITVVAMHRADFVPDLAEGLREIGVNVILLGPVSGRLCRHPAIVPTLAENVPNCDIVHVHALWEEIQYQATVAAKRFRKPYVLRPCGMLDPWSLSQSRWVKRVYRIWRLQRMLNDANAVHFTSQSERDLTEPLRIKAPSLVESNGVDLSEFDPLPEPGAFRRAWPATEDRPIVLFLSRLHHKKGLELLVPAFAEIDNSDAVLVIAGPPASDEYRQTLQQAVEAHGIGDRVIFTGMLYGRQRVEAMADADIFVLPSYQENFGIVVVEALAAGTPVLISDQINIHREIADAQVGQVFPLQVRAITDVIERWLSDEPLRSTAAQRARPFVWECYDWAKIARRWGRHYERLLAEKRPASRATDQ